MALSLASSTTQDPLVRQSALLILIMLGDTAATGPMLLDVYQPMKLIIENRPGGIWDDTSKNALDVISNICIHRSINEQLRTAGADTFLTTLLKEPGFPGVQAAIALTHMVEPDSLQLFAAPIVNTLVKLLGNALDGDIAFGIKWELIPGPLSSVKYLVKSSADRLLDAGVMEQLLRVVAESINPGDITGALEVLESLMQTSERAQHEILLSEHAIQEAHYRLEEYMQASFVARRVLNSIDAHDESKGEL
jgi:hypothetical protein